MNIKRYIATALAAAVLVSCTYPFNPDLSTFEERLVIEGDILVGGITDVRISMVEPLSGKGWQSGQGKKQISCEAWVEAEDGTVYKSSISGTRCLINTSDADAGKRYMLHVLDRISGEEYATPWLEVQPKADIDSLTFTYDKMYDALKFNISVTASERARYFRWSFEEDWEYHSRYPSVLEYLPPGTYPRDEELKEQPDYGIIIDRVTDIYYCWGHGESYQIMIGTTNNLTQDKLIEHNFYRVPCLNPKLQSLYRLRVTMRTLTREGYIYWNNIFQNSNDTGSLTSPMPSEFRGNITSLADPDKYVLGYISATEISTKDIYYDNTVLNYYVDRTEYQDLEPIPQEEWPVYYRKRYIPVEFMSVPMEGPQYFWAPERCVDCRTAGGTKNKPADWPTAHK